MGLATQSLMYKGKKNATKIIHETIEKIRKSLEGTNDKGDGMFKGLNAQKEEITQKIKKQILMIYDTKIGTKETAQQKIDFEKKVDSMIETIWTKEVMKK